MFKKVIYNTGSQIIGKIVSAFSTLVITLLIGRSLGPSGFGEFSKIFVFIGYFYTFADFGFNSIFVVHKLTPPSRLFRVLLGLRLVMSLVLAIVAITVSLFLPYNLQASTGFSPLVKLGIAIASLTIVTQALITSGNALFQKKLRYDLSALATATGSLVMLVATFFLFLITHSILPYVFVYILGGTIYVALSFAFISGIFKQSLLPIFDIERFKSLLTLSWPIGVALILNLVYFRIDVLILSSWRESAEVGLYNLGYQFFQAALAVPIFFTNALFPLLADSFRKNIKEFNKIIKTWFVYLILFSFALMIFLIVVSYLIPVIYDSRYLGSGIALRILSLGMPFFFTSALLWHLLIIYDKQKLLIYIYAIGAAFNLIANLIFIPLYGYIAASFITVISEILITLLLILSLKPEQFVSQNFSRVLYPARRIVQCLKFFVMAAPAVIQASSLRLCR